MLQFYFKLVEFVLEHFVDIIDNGANRTVGENTVQSGDELLLVKVRIGPTVPGSVWIYRAGIARKERTGSRSKSESIPFRVVNSRELNHNLLP